VEIRDAVARVTIIPEARADVAVSVIQANPRLPLKVSRNGEVVVIDGDLAGRAHGCHSAFGRPSVSVWGVGRVGYDEMPRVLIRAPINVKVGAGGAVFGVIGRGESVDLANSGCGDWTVANVSGPLTLRLSGSGDVQAGGAGSADFRVSGSADIVARAIGGGLTTATSGSGDITADWVGGVLHSRIAGSGNVRVKNGAVSDMDVAISGSGDVDFGGVAQTLEVQVAGSGDVTVARVNGAVSKRVAGSGDVRVGRWGADNPGLAPK
jgi:hypothetical protein